MAKAKQAKAAATRPVSKNPRLKSAKADGEPARGRPVAKTFINVLVKVSTRKSLNELKVITGLKTQGEILDILVAEAMKQRPQ